MEVDIKKIKSIVLIGLIGLSLVGCVKPENNNEGLKLTENSENDVIDESTDTAADSFIKDLESIKDTGLGLCVEVEDGVAKEVSVSP